jgi:hypothetical protein
MTQSYNVMGAVRLRMANSNKSATGVLTVPAEMMRFLTVDTLFKPEFTDEGILYRFVGSYDDAVTPPDWAKS